MNRTASARPHRQRWAAALVGSAAAGVLAACGQQSPGAAARVDGETIPFDEVNAYAGAVCEFTRTSAELAGQAAQPVSGAEVRGFVLDLLVRERVTDQVAEEMGVSVPPSVAAQEPDAQTMAVIEAMPEDEGARLADIYADTQRTSALQRAIGEQLLSGEQANSAQAADRRGAEAVNTAQQEADIVVDPRLEEAYDARLSSLGGPAPLTTESPLVVAESAEAAGPEAGADGESAPSTCS